MREERSGSTRRPLAINDDFFDRLAHIVGERTELALQDIARSTKTPLDRVRAIAVREVVPTPERERINYANEEEVAAARREINENYEIRTIQHELDGQLDAGFSVTYDTGYSARGNSLTELKTFMANESGRPESIRIDCGQGWRGTSFNLTLRDGYTTGRFEVKGNRRDIDYYYTAIRRLMKESEPDYPFLHFRVMSVLFSGIVSGLLYLGIFNTIMRMFPELTNLPITTPIVAAIILAPVLFGMIVSNLVQKMYERTFPKCQFEYGPEWRRQRSRRNLLLVIITTVAIPILLTILLPAQSPGPTRP